MLPEPYVRWRKHVVAPGERFFVWYLEPATVLCLMRVRLITVPVMQAYLRVADAIRRMRYDELEAAGGVASVNDWGECELPHETRRFVKEYYQTSRTKGRIRARFMSVSDAPKTQMAYNLLNMNVSLLQDHVPLISIPDVQEALEALGTFPPKFDPEIQGLNNLLSESDFPAED